MTLNEPHAVGFDFGTTNSLISIVNGDGIINFVDDQGRPIPSVVQFGGESVVVGREAKEFISGPGLGVSEDIVSSPKTALKQEWLMVAGVPRRPEDVASEVIKFVRDSAVNRPRGVLRETLLHALSKAVVTIPVTMEGPARARLRRAFEQAGIEIIQFLHEPLSAIFGYIESSKDRDEVIRRLRDKKVLVVDWGGGTLDVTLCRISDDRISQISNAGSEEVGGDVFDDNIRRWIVDSYVRQNPELASIKPSEASRRKLLRECEYAKIGLSRKEEANVYVSGFFSGANRALEFTMGREDFQSATRGLVAKGIATVRSVLNAAGVSPSEVAECLVVGGMSAMPAIREALYELFSPVRVIVPEDAATLIAQGAARFAHTGGKLLLSKPIEVELARGQFMTIATADSEMPEKGSSIPSTGFEECLSVFCADPSFGQAVLPVVTPQDLGDPRLSLTPRVPIGKLQVAARKNERPLVERFWVRKRIDRDLVFEIQLEEDTYHSMDTIRVPNLTFSVKLESIRKKKGPRIGS